MLNDELERIWQNSAGAEGVYFDKSKLLIDLNSQLKSFDKILINRDRKEIIGALLVILLFGSGAFIFTDILSRLGMILGVAYGVLVIFMLKNVKRHKPTNHTLPIRDFLIEYRHYLAKERNLIVNVVYWYLLPPFVACILFFIGQNIGIIMFAANTTFVFGLYVLLYFLNRSGVKKTFDPLLKRMDETINNIESVEEI